MAVTQQDVLNNYAAIDRAANTISQDEINYWLNNASDTTTLRNNMLQAAQASLANIGSANLASAGSLDSAATYNASTANIANLGSANLASAGNLGSAARANLANLGKANQYSAITADVDNSQLVQNQLSNILASDSPYIQRAQALSNQASNRRGLINSTMAVQAGTTAAIDAAMPIAQADAQTQTQQRLANLGYKNTAAQFNAGAQNQFDLERFQWQNQINLANAAAQNQYVLTRYQTEADINARNAAAMNQFDLSRFEGQNQLNLANANAANAASQFNAAAQNQNNLTRYQTEADINARNAASKNQYGLAKFEAANRVNLANMESKNQASQVNAGIVSQQMLANKEIASRENLANKEFASRENLARYAAEMDAYQKDLQRKNDLLINNMGITAQSADRAYTSMMDTIAKIQSSAMEAEPKQQAVNDALAWYEYQVQMTNAISSGSFASFIQNNRI